MRATGGQTPPPRNLPGGARRPTKAAGLNCGEERENVQRLRAAGLGVSRGREGHDGYERQNEKARPGKSWAAGTGRGHADGRKASAHLLLQRQPETERGTQGAGRRL